MNRNEWAKRVVDDLANVALNVRSGAERYHELVHLCRELVRLAEMDDAAEVMRRGRFP